MPWTDLNKRQQKYLQAIYDQDQETNAMKKGNGSEEAGLALLRL